MMWGNDHHGKTTFGRWENALHDAYYGETDDLTDAVCARCGTDALLHRPSASRPTATGAARSSASGACR